PQDAADGGANTEEEEDGGAHFLAKVLDNLVIGDEVEGEDSPGQGAGDSLKVAQDIGLVGEDVLEVFEADLFVVLDALGHEFLDLLFLGAAGRLLGDEEEEGHQEEVGGGGDDEGQAPAVGAGQEASDNAAGNFADAPG